MVQILFDINNHIFYSPTWKENGRKRKNTKYKISTKIIFVGIWYNSITQHICSFLVSLSWVPCRDGNPPHNTSVGIPVHFCFNCFSCEFEVYFGLPFTFRFSGYSGNLYLGQQMRLSWSLWTGSYAQCVWIQVIPILYIASNLVDSFPFDQEKPWRFESFCYNFKSRNQKVINTGMLILAVTGYISLLDLLIFWTE